MELIEIDLKLPDVFYDVEQKLKQINLNTKFEFVIAGGSLCNLYLGKSVKDLDIFFNANDYTLESETNIKNALSELFSFQGVEVEMERVPGYREWLSIPALYRVKYRDYLLEFIPCSIERVYDFDLRFRQFYFHDSKVYASKGALDDIEYKQLTVVSPSSPLSTLSRIFRFEEQFGFKTDQTSMNFLLSYCNHLELDYDYFKNYVFSNKMMSDNAKDKMLQLLQRAEKIPTRFSDGQTLNLLHFKNVEFPFDKQLETIVFNYLDEKEHTGFGLFYDELLNYNSSSYPAYKLHLDYKYFKNKFELFAEQVHEFFHKYKLLCVTSGLSVPFKEIPKSEWSVRYKEYFSNESLKKVFEFYQRHDGGMHYYGENSYFDLSILKYGSSFPDIVNVKFIPTDDRYTSISDVLTGNSLMMVINDVFCYRIRKCTNGKYTIAGLKNNPSPDSGEYFLLQIFGEAMKEQYPEFFDFYNEELFGIYSYPFSHSYDYFFEKAQFSSTFLSRRKKETFMPINFQRSDY